MIGSKPKRLLYVCKCVCMCTACLSLQLCKAPAPPYGLLCARLSLTHSLFLSPLPPSFSLCTNAYHSPVSDPSCQCSIMVLHELSVRQPLTTKSELEQIGRRDAGVHRCCCVSCHHSLITKLLYLMPSGNRNDFLSCYL